MTILLVDDEPLALRALSTCVNWKQLKFRKVYTALSVGDAKRIMDSSHIDILFTDVEMPEENGIQLLQWVHIHHPHIVYALITGHDDFHYIKTAFHLESADYILKPIQVDEFLDTIERMVRKLKGQEESKRIRHYADQWISEQSAEIRKRDEVENSPEQLALDVENYMHEHLTEELSIETISNHFHFSSDHLNRLYKKVRGTTLNQYLIRSRMDLAIKLLQDGKMNASQISDYLGYSSYPSFVNTFKKIYGVPPSAYAKRS